MAIKDKVVGLNHAPNEIRSWIKDNDKVSIRARNLRVIDVWSLSGPTCAAPVAREHGDRRLGSCYLHVAVARCSFVVARWSVTVC